MDEICSAIALQPALVATSPRILLHQLRIPYQRLAQTGQHRLWPGFEELGPVKRRDLRDRFARVLSFGVDLLGCILEHLLSTASDVDFGPVDYESSSDCYHFVSAAPPPSWSATLVSQCICNLRTTQRRESQSEKLSHLFLVRYLRLSPPRPTL